MACFDQIECLGEYCSCGDNIILNLVAPVTGILDLYVKFNGILIKREIEVSATTNIQVPNVFNENYTHEIWFVDSDGNLINDIHYSVKIIICAGETPVIVDGDYDLNDYDSSEYL